MHLIQHKRNWLYAAITVLLLQSFALWHDAVHAFHIDEIQCEHLSAINHLPTADIQSDISISPLFVSITTDKPLITFTLPVRPRDHHTIRAPPSYS